MGKPGVKFGFPDAHFVKDLTDGKLLDEAGRQILEEANIELSSLGNVINHVFHRIAIHYSPHESTLVRQAQLTSLQRHCHLKDRSNRERSVSHTSEMKHTPQNEELPQSPAFSNDDDGSDSAKI